MRQSVSAQLAAEGLTWDRILEAFYPGGELTALSLPPAGFALRFNGTGSDGMGANRLQIPVHEMEGERGNPVNVGAGDFTIEWWMKAYAQENDPPAQECGRQASWINGNIILDRSRPEKYPGFGVSLAGGLVVFGVTGPDGRSLTLCGHTPITDGGWHHLAIQRQAADGRLWLFVDGRVDAEGQGPPGDISYPAGFESAYPEREPFLSLGGWKQGPDHFRHPFFQGAIDELRFSGRVRYLEPFPPPQEAFTADEHTLALYHFDEGLGSAAQDSSGNFNGPAGTLLFGGAISGPEWIPSSLFTTAWSIYLPSVNLNRGH
jgi:hypothetical protein